MIQYIVAAGVGALLGSSTKKGRKSYAQGGQTDKGLEQSLKRFEEIRRASELSDAQARQRRRLRQHQTGMSAGAFAKGGEIDEDILVVDVVWRQLNEKGLGKFRLKERDIERLEDNYGSTYYFEPYDYTNEKPISYTKMKNILDKSMKEMGLMDSNFAKGGKIDFANRTSDDFRLGELVYDTSNKDYGTIIGIWDEYPSDKYEVKLDSDGMQPTANLRKLGEKGDSGSKKQLFDAVSAYERLLRSFPDMDYPPMINNPFYAKGGEVTTDEALAKAEYLEDYGVEAEQLDDQYLGEWDSPEDFVASWIDETGGMEGLIDPERFYEIDRIGFRDWAMGMAEAMSEDIDENNADEYAERLDLEMEYSDAVDEDKLDDFIQTLQEKEAEAVYDDFMTNYTTADEIINDLGPNYGMSIEDLERAYLIQPDYTAIADAFEDDGYVYIKKGGKTFVFNYNMKRGGRTKKCMSCGGTTHAKGGYVRPKNLALPERHYQTLADAIDKVVDHYGKEEIKDYIERNGAQGRYAVYRQATNRIWMDDDNPNLRGDRFGIKHDPDWRTRTRMYTDAHFDSATKSILKQKLGTKTMAKGGKTKSRKKVSDFDKLAMKVASNYRGKAVPKKYQSKYGKRYDNEEAMEVGRAVASKVYRQQQAKKGKK